MRPLLEYTDVDWDNRMQACADDLAKIQQSSPVNTPLLHIQSVYWIRGGPFSVSLCSLFTVTWTPWLVPVVFIVLLKLLRIDGPLHTPDLPACTASQPHTQHEQQQQQQQPLLLPTTILATLRCIFLALVIVEFTGMAPLLGIFHQLFLGIGIDS